MSLASQKGGLLCGLLCQYVYTQIHWNILQQNQFLSVLQTKLLVLAHQNSKFGQLIGQTV